MEGRYGLATRSARTTPQACCNNPLALLLLCEKDIESDEKRDAAEIVRWPCLQGLLDLELLATRWHDDRDRGKNKELKG